MCTDTSRGPTPHSSTPHSTALHPTGLHKSTNGGVGWSAASLPGVRVQALAIDASAPATLYGGTDGLGVVKSTDGGATGGFWSCRSYRCTTS